MAYTVAFDYVSEFFTDKRKFGVASESFRSGRALDFISITSVLDLPYSRPVDGRDYGLS